MRLKNLVLLICLASCVLFTIAGAAAVSKCGSEDSKCGDGSCLPKGSLCNGVKDCPRGEDERYCNRAYTYTTEEATTREYCDDTQYRCYDGSCIPLGWVCDGYRDCRYGEDEEYCYSTDITSDRYTYPTSDPYPWTSPYPWTTRDPYPGTTPEPPTECKRPFQIIGNKCIMIEPLVEGTWYEARYFCQGFGGDLVVLDSLDSYAEIVKFLNEAKLTTRDYWVGATDEGHEGEWRWVNWAKVMSGTPLWALYGSGSRYYQEPLSNNNSTQDCGYLDMTRFYYLDDEECTEMKAAICEIEPYQEGEPYQDDETYSGKVLEFLKSSQDRQEPSEKDLGSKDSEEGNVNDGEKAKEPESHGSGHEELAVEGEGVREEPEARPSEKRQSTKTVGKFIEKLRAKTSRGKVESVNETSKRRQNVGEVEKIIEQLKAKVSKGKVESVNETGKRRQNVEDVEKIIGELKEKVYHARFGNMNLIRP